MGQARGQRTQPGELLPLAQRRLHRAEPRDGGADDGQRHVRSGVEQLANRLDRDAERLGLRQRAHRREAAAALEGRDLALERPGADPGERDLARAGALRDLELAVEDDVEGVGHVALRDQHVVRRQVDDLAALDQAGQLRVVEAAEERGIAQPLRDRIGRKMRVAHSWARYWWTSATAMAPSPTALAIRFTESWRTSPAAKSPGRLDSRRNGGRSRLQPCSRPTLGPVRT